MLILQVVVSLKSPLGKIAMKFQLGIILLLSFFCSTTATYASDRLSESKIKQLIIQDSISNYPGNCPCPYNTARNGSSCGRRSAYSRPGGYAPICYESDVTQQMVHTYRASHHE
jgi:hypothetical protein